MTTTEEYMRRFIEALDGLVSEPWIVTVNTTRADEEDE